MAAGLPVAATRIGALTDLLPDAQLAEPGDAAALGALAVRLRGDTSAAHEGLRRVRAACAPEVVAPLLAAAYGD
jgi:hypothetical protein